MSDPWQECMDHCVEVTKKAGKVSNYIVTCFFSAVDRKLRYYRWEY